MLFLLTQLRTRNLINVTSTYSAAPSKKQRQSPKTCPSTNAIVIGGIEYQCLKFDNDNKVRYELVYPTKQTT